MSYKSSVVGFDKRLKEAQHDFEARGKVPERLTRVEFAKKVGVSQPTVSDWFNGNRIPDLEQTDRIAHLLGVSPGWLGFNEGEMLPADKGTVLSPSTPGKHLEPSVDQPKRGSGSRGR